MLSEPCEWPWSFVGDCDAYRALNPDEQSLIVGAATTSLWEWSGRRYGLCPTTLRPEVRCDRQSCSGVSQVRLPGPIASVTEVLEEGLVLPASEYRIDNDFWLVRVGDKRWICCQDMTEPPTAENTWQVTYQRGIPVPPGGRMAAGVLICELAKAVNEDKNCRLPKRVQTITKQGMTVGFLDDFENLEAGRTGIWEIDQWLASLERPSWSVTSPNYHSGTGHRRTS